MYRPNYSEVFTRLASFVDVSKVESSESWSVDDEREQAVVTLLKSQGFDPRTIALATGIPEDVVSFYWS